MAGSLQRSIAIAVQLINRDFDRGVAAVRAQLAALRREVDENDKTFDKINNALGKLAKPAAVLAALGPVIGIVAGTTAALQNLLPIVLLLPAALLAGGAAIATFKLATSGFADAVKKGGEDLAKLSPQARATAEAVRALGPAFEQVKRSVQDAFFKNFAADVQQVGATYLPMLQKRLPAIAAGFNAMGRSVAFALTRPATSNAIDIVLVNTARSLAGARNALGGFITGFALLGASGSGYLSKLGVAIDGVAQRFQRFAERITADGSFERFVDNAVQGFRDLFNIIGDVSAIVGSIFSGLAGPQGDVLGSLRTTTEALRAFFEAASTQTALTAFGDALRAVSDAVRTVLIAALEQLAPIIANLAPVIAEIATLFGDTIANAIGIVGPLIVGLSGFLNDHKEIVALVAEALLLLYGRFLILKGIGVATAAIAAVTRAIGGLAGALRLIPLVALAAIAVELDKINVAAAGGDPAKLTGMAENLNDLVGAGKQLLTLDIGGIVADIQDELGQTGEALSTGQAPIVQNFQKFVDTTRDSLGQIGGFFADLGTAVSTNVGKFVETTKTSFGQIGDFFSEKVTEFQQFPGQVAAAIGDKASEIWTGFLENLRTAFQPVRDFFSLTPFEMGKAIGERIGELLNAGILLTEQLRLGAVQKFEEVATFFREAPGRLAAEVSGLATLLATKATEAWESFKAAAAIKIEETRAEAAALPGKVGEALAQFGTFLATKATEAWESFKLAAQIKLAEVVADVVALPGKIISALNPLPSQTQTKGTETGTGFRTGLTAAFDAAIAYVRGIPGSIVTAIGNTGSLLVNAGRALMDGLLEGIKAGFQAALDFARGIAAGIAAVKGPLSYDKRVLTPAGLALMAGLQAGMQTGYADVRAFAGGIGSDLASTIDTGSILAGASRAAASVSANRPDPALELLRQIATASAAGTTVLVQIGERELTDIVATEVASRDRSTRRTVRAGAS